MKKNSTKGSILYQEICTGLIGHPEVFGVSNFFFRKEQGMVYNSARKYIVKISIFRRKTRTLFTFFIRALFLLAGGEPFSYFGLNGKHRAKVALDIKKQGVAHPALREPKKKC